MEGVRGHPVRELRRYLGRREVVCEPIGGGNEHRCRVAKIPLKDWFRTIHLMLTKRGLTIVEVQRTIDLGSYRSAWYLCHRIRAALTNDGFRKLVGVVEVNEDREKTVSASTSTRPRNWGEDHAGIQFRAHRNHARRARTGNDKGAPRESNSCDKGSSR